MDGSLQERFIFWRGLSNGSIHTIMRNQLQYRKVCAQWVPNHLTRWLHVWGSPGTIPEGIMFFPVPYCHRGRNIARNTLQRLTRGLLQHPPYNPDLSPCDLCIFEELKRDLRKLQFGSDEDVCYWVKMWFCQQPTNLLKNGSTDLSPSWINVLNESERALRPASWLRASAHVACSLVELTERLAPVTSDTLSLSIILPERGGTMIWVAHNNEVLRADGVQMRREWSSTGMQGRGKLEITEKTRRLAKTWAVRYDFTLLEVYIADGCSLRLHSAGRLHSRWAVRYNFTLLDLHSRFPGRYFIVLENYIAAMKLPYPLWQVNHYNCRAWANEHPNKIIQWEEDTSKYKKEKETATVARQETLKCDCHKRRILGAMARHLNGVGVKFFGDQNAEEGVPTIIRAGRRYKCCDHPCRKEGSLARIATLRCDWRTNHVLARMGLRTELRLSHSGRLA
ncbi:hypothetical protein PR048_005377 [Dryococelus australis]|uniref:Uncharacterized protein n=1 Tax=Dryococelus australis TaxID=614101 RepID=A0ABQ9I840_9NEOP|nr:hypothetical protein PR048_005377 [Dryococelus australis]